MVLTSSATHMIVVVVVVATSPVDGSTEPLFSGIACVGPLDAVPAGASAAYAGAALASDGPSPPWLMAWPMDGSILWSTMGDTLAPLAVKGTAWSAAVALMFCAGVRWRGWSKSVTRELSGFCSIVDSLQGQRRGGQRGERKKGMVGRKGSGSGPLRSG